MVRTVRRTIAIPQLLVDTVADVRVVLVVQVPQVQVDAPVLQAVRVPQVVIIPVAAQRLTSLVSLTMEIPQLLLDEVVDVLLAGGASSTGAVVEKTVVLPQLLLLRNSLRAVHVLMWGGFFRALYTGTGPGVVSTDARPPQIGASRASSWINMRRFTPVRTTTTTTTTTTTRARLSKSCQHQCGDSVSLVSSGCYGMPWRTRQRCCKAPQGAPSSSVASPRAADGADGLVRSSPPRCASGGERCELSPKGTEDAQGRWAAGRPEGARAAGGSHGRLRGCPGSAPRGGVDGGG